MHSIGPILVPLADRKRIIRSTRRVRDDVEAVWNRHEVGDPVIGHDTTRMERITSTRSADTEYFAHQLYIALTKNDEPPPCSRFKLRTPPKGKLMGEMAFVLSKFLSFK